MPRLPWRSLLAWTALGMVLGLGLLFFNYQQSVDTLGSFVDSTPADVSAPVFAAELGDDALRPGGFHDGHYFYLIARAPMHFDASVPYLDRAGYRLGRPVYPWAAWALHPTGGGWGLVAAMVAVGVLSLFLGAMASGALSVSLGGAAWPAAVFPVVLGSVLSLRISVPDPLAVALALTAITLLYRKHLVGALIVAALAALTKESVLLLFLGILIARRDRESVALVALPGFAYVAWQVWLRIALGDVGKPVDEIGRPLSGLIDSVHFWLDGGEPLGFLAVATAFVLTALALAKRGFGHPLSWALVLQVAFVLLLNISVIGPERNASRAVLPMTVLAVILLGSPVRGRERRRAPVDAVTGGG